MRSRVPLPLLRRTALVVACAVALAPAAPAADPETDRASDDGAPTLHGALRLSLGDAIAMALENNLDVEIARHAPLIAEEDLMIAWGAFDPLVTGDVGYFDDEQPNTFAIAGVARTKQDSLDGGLGFSTLLPYVGATLGMEYTGARTTNNSVLQTLRPQYDSGLAFTANVPLARDLVEIRLHFRERDVG